MLKGWKLSQRPRLEWHPHEKDRQRDIPVSDIRSLGPVTG